MVQNWRKHGLINFNNPVYGAASHYSVPFALHLAGDVFRVYFSPRDHENCSFITFADINILTRETVYISEGPLLTKGELGAFDDAGVVLFQILNVGKKNYLFYSGWMLGVSVPFYFWVGLAAEDDKGTFTKVSKAPLLACDDFDPFLTGAPYVIYESPVWKMWYVSGIKWEMELERPKHYYTVKYAESTDGIHWKRSEHICLPFKNSNEYAIGRPVVIKEDDIYKMWFSFRGSEKSDTYRIGYAESADGLEWKRLDEMVNMDVAEKGWDSEMICYGHVFDHDNNRYMLYNGNGYGQTGIGLAILEK